LPNDLFGEWTAVLPANEGKVAHGLVHQAPAEWGLVIIGPAFAQYRQVIAAGARSELHPAALRATIDQCRIGLGHIVSLPDGKRV
jgi:hypothetical protein